MTNSLKGHETKHRHPLITPLLSSCNWKLQPPTTLWLLHQNSKHVKQNRITISFPPRCTCVVFIFSFNSSSWKGTAAACRTCCKTEVWGLLAAHNNIHCTKNKNMRWLKLCPPINICHTDKCCFSPLTTNEVDFFRLRGYKPLLEVYCASPWNVMSSGSIDLKECRVWYLMGWILLRGEQYGHTSVRKFL